MITRLIVHISGDESRRLDELQSATYRIWQVFYSFSVVGLVLLSCRIAVAEEMEVDESETAPEFTTPLQKCVAEEGAIAALECAVAGNVEKVIWYVFSSF